MRDERKRRGGDEEGGERVMMRGVGEGGRLYTDVHIRTPPQTPSL